MFSICLLSYSLSRLWLCAPAARKDVNCAGQQIHVRVRTVHVLLIPGSALNRVSISKLIHLLRDGGRQDRLASPYGFAHAQQNSHSTTSHLHPYPSKSKYIPTIVYITLNVFGGLRYALRPEPCAVQCVANISSLARHTSTPP